MPLKKIADNITVISTLIGIIVGGITVWAFLEKRIEEKTVQTFTKFQLSVNQKMFMDRYRFVQDQKEHAQNALTTHKGTDHEAIFQKEYDKWQARWVIIDAAFDKKNYDMQ